MRILPKIGHNYYVSRLLTGYLLVLLSLLTINSTNAKQGNNCSIFLLIFYINQKYSRFIHFFNLTSIILKFYEQYLEFKNSFFKFKYSAQLLIAKYFRKYTLNLWKQSINPYFDQIFQRRGVYLKNSIYSNSIFCIYLKF
jgi:hypothetical protein